MQYSTPPIFRTDTQRRLLVELLFGGDEPRTLTDLAGAIDVDPTTVMREIDRLAGCGLIAERRIGRARTVTIDEASPHAAPLRRLLEDEDDTEDRAPGPRVARPARRLRAESGRHDRRPLPSARQRP